MRNLWIITVAIMLWGVTGLQSAHAYIDPGAGSFIFQILIAFFVGAAFVIKGFWRQICVFFKSRFGRGNRDDDADG